MALRAVRIPLQTMAAATDDYTTENIKGQIRKITIISSASNNYKAYALADDGTTAEEYIIGAVAATVTVNGTAHYYPVIEANKISDGTAYAEGADKSATRVPVIIDAPVKIEASAGTASDTWQVVIWYEIDS